MSYDGRLPYRVIEPSHWEGRAYGRTVFVVSPYSGKVEENTAYALAAAKFVYEAKCTPVVPHLVFPRFLNDTFDLERDKGMEMGRRLMDGCNEIWVFTDRGISAGMESDIEYATSLGRSVTFKHLPQSETARLIRDTLAPPFPAGINTTTPFNG